MKTIKIYLGTNGSITSFDAPNWVNQYSYNDTLINVYVPSELIPQLDNEYAFDSDDELVSTTTYTYGIQMAMNITQINGTQKLGNTYNFKYVKDGITINGVEYTLYERKMPLEFTLYSGTQTYGIGVVSYKNVLEMGESTPTTYTIGNISSYSFDMTINSALNIVDNPIETDTDLSTLIAQINTLSQQLSLKQNIADSHIIVTTTNGGNIIAIQVVGALNALHNRVNENYSKNNTQDNRLDIAEGKIQTLETQAITGFRYVGAVNSTIDPNTEGLNGYMIVLGLTVQNGDIVIWNKKISGATDVSYQCIYGASGWTWTTIPTVESATNFEAGLIQGATSATANGVNAFASIVGGKIQDIFYLQNGNYYSITDIGNNKTNIANIVNGTTVVGKSLYATYDSSEIGNANPTTIANKFLNTTNGASKQYVKDYALPRQFNDVYRLELNSDGFSTFTTEPTYATTTKSKAISGIGHYMLDHANLSTSDYTYQLSSKNSFTFSPLIYFNNDIENVSFIVGIVYGNTNLAVVETETYDFTANTYKKIVISDYLNQLGTDFVNVENGTPINVFLEVKTSETPENNTTAYIISDSNEYATTFSLSTNSYTITSSTSGIILHELAGTYDADNETFTFDMGNVILADKSQHLFVLSGMYDTLPSNTKIVIEADGTAYTFIATDYTLDTLYDYRQFISDTQSLIIFNASYIYSNGIGTFNLDNANVLDSLYYVKDLDIISDLGNNSYELNYETFFKVQGNKLIFKGSQLGLSLSMVALNLNSVELINGNNVYNYSYVYTDSNGDEQHFNAKIIFDFNNSTAIITYTITKLVKDTDPSQVITADKINVNEVRDLTGSGDVKTTYNSSYIENKVTYTNSNNDVFTTTYKQENNSISLIRNNENDDNSISKTTMLFNDANMYLECYYHDGNDTTTTRLIGLYNNKLHLTYKRSSDTIDGSGLEQLNSYNWELFTTFDRGDEIYDYAKVKVFQDNDTPKVKLISTEDNDGTITTNEVVLTPTSFTHNNNPIIDTNNATTELFLTDAEMTTLLSEVFD